jgi:DNA-binding transcriptional ArsR family regulator
MNTITDLTLDQSEKRIVHALQLLGDPTRFKIFKLLSSDEELCVSEIANRLDISPSAVSQHFRNFEMIGLVSKDRKGQKICYSLSHSDPLVRELRIITKQ